MTILRVPYSYSPGILSPVLYVASHSEDEMDHYSILVCLSLICELDESYVCTTEHTYKTGNRITGKQASGHSKIPKSKHITVKLFIENAIFTCVGLSDRTNTCLITRLQLFFEKPRSAFSHARVLFDGYCWR